MIMFGTASVFVAAIRWDKFAIFRAGYAWTVLAVFPVVQLLLCIALVIARRLRFVDAMIVVAVIAGTLYLHDWIIAECAAVV